MAKLEEVEEPKEAQETFTNVLCLLPVAYTWVTGLHSSFVENLRFLALLGSHRESHPQDYRSRASITPGSAYIPFNRRTKGVRGYNVTVLG